MRPCRSVTTAAMRTRSGAAPSGTSTASTNMTAVDNARTSRSIVLGTGTGDWRLGTKLTLKKAAPGGREAAGRGVKQQHAVRGTRHCQQLQTLAERVTRSSSPSVGGVAIKKPSDGSFAFD